MRHGLALLCVTAVAILLQTLFNVEVMRYTLATGEPVFTGFMRTRPSSTWWAWFYAVLYFLQAGWPAWAANAAGAFFFLYTRQLAGPGDAGVVYGLGVAAYLLCVVILLVGRRIERTLELLNWVLLTCILGSFLVLALLYVPADTWMQGFAGMLGIDAENGGLARLPAGVDWVLLASLVAYSGCGGVGNLTLSNWARDRGYGMGERVGYIPAAVGGKKVHLAHTGFSFPTDEPNLRRWRGWWRIVRADQWGVFFLGGLAGMLLPSLVYVALPRAGHRHPGARHRRGARAGHGAARRSARRRARSRSSAPGSCSRPSSTASKAWCARSPTCCGPAARACAPGAAATCDACTTPCWRRW